MNIREIARLADVTPGTVSKVLNNYSDVGEATRKHVLEIRASRCGSLSRRRRYVLRSLCSKLHRKLNGFLRILFVCDFQFVLRDGLVFRD